MTLAKNFCSACLFSLFPPAAYYCDGIIVCANTNCVLAVACCPQPPSVSQPTGQTCSVVTMQIHLIDNSLIVLTLARKLMHNLHLQNL